MGNMGYEARDPKLVLVPRAEGAYDRFLLIQRELATATLIVPNQVQGLIHGVVRTPAEDGDRQRERGAVLAWCSTHRGTTPQETHASARP